MKPLKHFLLTYFLCSSLGVLNAIEEDTEFQQVIPEANYDKKAQIKFNNDWNTDNNVEIASEKDKPSYLEPIIQHYSEQNYENDSPIQEPTTISQADLDTESINKPIIDHQFWPTTQSYLYLREKPITEVIQDFCKMQDVNVVLSDKLQKNTQKVHQSFEKAYPINIWEQLTKTYGLLWFFDGHVLYVYESGEIETKILKVHPHQIDPLLKLTTELGFYGSNIGINPMKESGIIVVSGAPKMIQIFEDTTQNMQFYKDIDMDVQDVKVFPLKHAWADDKTIGNLTIPGVATMLNNILGKTVETKPTFSQPQTSNAQRIKSIKDLEKEAENNPSEETPKIILPEGGLITTDTRQNAIIVKDYTKNLPLYENIIKKLDVPLELIEIQAAIVNVSKNCGFSLGLNRLSLGKNKIDYQPIGEKISDSQFSFRLKGIVNGSEFLTTINALESKKQSKVLARPSVITMNNMAALMEQSQTYYLPIKGTKSGDMFSITGSTKLQVTPHLISQGGLQQIQLILDIKDESIVPGKTTEDKNNVSSSNISTQAIVYEGQSVLIGGYFKEEYSNGSDGVPFLKDLPVLGYIFKNSNKSKGTSERLFLITPKIIHLSANEDAYGGLFETPSTLLEPSERVRMTYVNKDALLLDEDDEIVYEIK